MIKMFNNAGGEPRSNLSAAGRGDCHNLLFKKKKKAPICNEREGYRRKKKSKSRGNDKRVSAAESYIITHHNTSTLYMCCRFFLPAQTPTLGRLKQG